MLIPLCLALLGHLSIATAQQSGSGLRVFPNTGPLSVFPGISWRYNGEVDPWGKESNLDFVPMIKDEATVERMYFAATSWLAKPYISHVFSLDAPYLNGMSASKGAELQRKISEGISTSGLGQYQLGLPSLSIKHGQVVSTGLEWIRALWQQCQGDCMRDFFVVDYEGDNAATMAAVLEALHTEFQMPLWVKTLRCVNKEDGYCTEEVATLFMNDAIGWFKSSGDDIVERWAWDGADPSIASLGDPTGMLNADGTLNAMGKKYDELR